MIISPGRRRPEMAHMPLLIVLLLMLLLHGGRDLLVMLQCSDGHERHEGIRPRPAAEDMVRNRTAGEELVGGGVGCGYGAAWSSASSATVGGAESLHALEVEAVLL